MENTNTIQQHNDSTQQPFNSTPTVLTRIYSWLLGILMMIAFAFGLFVLLFILSRFTGGVIPSYITEHTITLFIAAGLCNDIQNGRSFAKLALRLQVMDNTTGKCASPVQTVVRNISLILLPLELIMMLINPARRLGDYIANTRVEKHTESSWSDYKYSHLQIWSAVLISIVIALVLNIFILFRISF